MSQRRIGLWYYPLVVHHTHPGSRAEPLTRRNHKQAMFPEHLTHLAESVWNRHVLAIAPELGVFAFRHMIVQNDEIANPVEHADNTTVVLLNEERAEIPVGKEV